MLIAYADYQLSLSIVVLPHLSKAAMSIPSGVALEGTSDHVPIDLCTMHARARGGRLDTPRSSTTTSTSMVRSTQPTYLVSFVHSRSSLYIPSTLSYPDILSGAFTPVVNCEVDNILLYLMPAQWVFFRLFAAYSLECFVASSFCTQSFAPKIYNNQDGASQCCTRHL